MNDLGEHEFEVLLYEFKADMAAYLSTPERNLPYSSLADLIAFNEANAATEMPYFGQEFFAMAEEKGPLSTPEYKDALENCRRLTRSEGIDAVGSNEIEYVVAFAEKTRPGVDFSLGVPLATAGDELERRP